MTWAWWLGTWLPFGFLTPVLFAGAAARTGRRSWFGWAALYAVAAYAGLVMTIAGEEDGDLDGAGSLLMVITWIAGIVHGFFARIEFARRLRAPAAPSALDRARATIAERREAQALVAREPEVALQMGVGRPDVPGAEHMHVVDVNRAGLRALAGLPGVDDARAAEIARAREEIDGFKSVEDLGIVLHLDGNAVEDLRPYVVFIPR
jgi:hypothetical protein